MKIFDIITTANRNMFQGKVRSILTIIAIFVGALTLTLTNGIGSGISSYIDRQLGNLGAENTLVVRAKFNETDNPLAIGEARKYEADREKEVSTYGGPAVTLLADADFEKIRAISDIGTVEPYRYVGIEYVTGPNGEKYELNVGDYLPGMRLDVVAGDVLQDDSDQLQVMLPLSYASALGFGSEAEAVGKTVQVTIKNARGELSDFPVQVRGVLQKNLLSSDGAKLNGKTLQALYEYQQVGEPEGASKRFFAATATFDPNLSKEKIDAVQKALSDKGYQGQTIADQIGIVQDVMSGLIAVLNVFGMIALVAASFGVINTLLMAVQERTKEIGLMKAIGMSRGAIFMLFSTEAILLGFWGSIFGVFAAMGIGALANSYATANFLQSFNGLNLLEFPLMSVGGIVLLIMIVTFLAGTLPARRAARLNPIDALRYE